MVATGLMYNTKVFAENSWAPPTSWNDLKDKKYSKKLVIPPINNTYGLQALVMLARMNGGGENNIDPGFKVFKDEINPNVLAYEPSPGKMTELFQSGQAVIAVWGTGRVRLRQHRLSRRLRLSEGRRGHAAVDRLSDRQAQRVAARSELRQDAARSEDPARACKDDGFGPVQEVDRDHARVRQVAPFGERAAKLYNPTGTVINEKREEWTKRWNREVER